MFRYLGVSVLAGPERTLQVINTGVNYLAVTRAGACAYGIGGFEYQHFTALQRQRPGDGQTDHTGTDHNTVNLFHYTV